MPKDRQQALAFLETQWSSINDNKVKGIEAELRFKEYLKTENLHHVPGGWILTPGNFKLSPVPAVEKICLLPKRHHFSWEDSPGVINTYTPAEIAAYNYFRQVGVRTYFVHPTNVVESGFETPTKSNGSTKAKYPRSYKLDLCAISPKGLPQIVSEEDVFRNFPQRQGNLGMRVYQSGRIQSSKFPWDNSEAVADLFWFEYSRYYFQKKYLVSNNDLDLFMIAESGQSFPVELKSKSPATDTSMGPWFGIDMGPFAKLSFFTANSMNTDALYIVEEVDSDRQHIRWHALKFSDLVKRCSWVGQSGGKGMSGGNSSTYKIPVAAFEDLGTLLTKL